MHEAGKNNIDKGGIALFFFLACALSWTFGILSLRNPLGLDEAGTEALGYAAKFGPSFAGVIVTAIVAGRAGLGELVGGLFHWRTGFGWYVFALGFPIVFTVVGTALWYAQQDAPPPIHLAAAITFVGWFLARFFMGGGLGEELGWRGFMLPTLQARWGVVKATLAVGICWGIWHWPAFFMDPEKSGAFPDVLVPMFLFTLLSVVYAFIFTYLYNGSGSLLLVVAMHATLNAVDSTLDQVVPGQEGDLIAAVLMLVSLVVFVPLVIRQARRQEKAGATPQI
jgi:uncharacterized protein